MFPAAHSLTYTAGVLLYVINHWYTMAGNITRTEPSFPYLSVGSLCLGMMAHTVLFTSPFAFVAFMVVDFGMAKDIDSAGYSAGWIASILMIGRLMSGIPWGMASDKWGRKPCLILSMLFACACGTLFGFSGNFWMAIAARFLLGVGNGFTGVAKASISEIVQTKAHENAGIRLFEWCLWARTDCRSCNWSLAC